MLTSFLKSSSRSSVVAVAARRIATPGFVSVNQKAEMQRDLWKNYLSSGSSSTELFQWIDHDGSGCLNSVDMRNFMQNIARDGVPPQALEAMQEMFQEKPIWKLQDFRQWLNCFTVVRTKTVSAEELVQRGAETQRALWNNYLGRRCDSQTLFEAIDKNGDGRVGSPEINEFLDNIEYKGLSALALKQIENNLIYKKSLTLNDFQLWLNDATAAHNTKTMKTSAEVPEMHFHWDPSFNERIASSMKFQSDSDAVSGRNSPATF